MPPGALVLHGFTGTPSSVQGVADALGAGGFEVFLPMLPGHGTSVEDMMTTGWEDWTAGAERAFEDLSAAAGPVVVAGLSMGAALGCWLATRRREIAGLVCVNPIVEPPAESFFDMLRGTIAAGVSFIPGPVGSDIARPGVVENAYGGAPLAPMLSLMQGVADMASQLARITCPLLLFTSRQDHVVPPSSSDYLAARVTGPVERVALERSFHVATLDWDAEEIERGTVAFALRVTSAGTP